MAGFLPTAPPFPSKESFASGPHLSVDRWSGHVLIQEMQPLCLDRDRHLGLDSSRWSNKGRVLSLEEPSGSTNLPEAPTVASMIAAVRPDPSLVVGGPAAVAAHPTPVVVATAQVEGPGLSRSPSTPRPTGKKELGDCKPPRLACPIPCPPDRVPRLGAGTLLTFPILQQSCPQGEAMLTCLSHKSMLSNPGSRFIASTVMDETRARERMQS